MIIYDICKQKPPKEGILILFGLVVVFAALIFLLRAFCVYSLSKKELILNILGVIGSSIIAVILISYSVNTTTEFKDCQKKAATNDCLVISGKACVLETYNIRSLNEDLVVFEIDGVRFDTFCLYRTNNYELKQNDIQAMINADEITIKYVSVKSKTEQETYNLILTIAIP